MRRFPRFSSSLRNSAGSGKTGFRQLFYVESEFQLATVKRAFARLADGARGGERLRITPKP